MLGHPILFKARTRYCIADINSHHWIPRDLEFQIVAEGYPQPSYAHRPLDEDDIHEAMLSFEKWEGLATHRHLATWDAIGVDVTRYPRLMQSAIICHLHINPVEQAMVGVSGLVLALMHRGLHLPAGHGTEFGWIEVVIALLSAGSAIIHPDLTRGLAKFIRS